MKKGLLGSTALIGATALIAGAAGAAEAPTWKLTGNVNFQFYYVDQDATGVASATWVSSSNGPTWQGVSGTGGSSSNGMFVFGAGTADSQDHDWYFGVDESELQLNVSGTADNGLNYGFKIEIQTNTTDGTVADEARLQLSGGWGTLQLGDEDGAEDVMNYGGESLMGATGGFDGDQDDYLFHAGGGITNMAVVVGGTTIVEVNTITTGSGGLGATMNVAAPSYPTIAGDSSDSTKVSYFSPSFSGFKVGASLTPTPNNGDTFKADGSWENNIGLGANYDNSFGGVRVRASAIYSMASNADDQFEDISAWSVGGIVGFGPFSLGANYTDNADSGQPLVTDWNNGGVTATAPIETSYWNVGASFETGPMNFAVGYFASVAEVQGFSDSTYDHIALTADYTVAPGLGVYAEINMISEELLGGFGDNSSVGGFTGTPASLGISTSNDATSLVLGMNVSF